MNTANAKKEKETTLQNLGNRSNVQAPQSTGFNRNQSTDNDQSGFGLGFGNTAGNRTRFGHGTNQNSTTSTAFGHSNGKP